MWPVALLAGVVAVVILGVWAWWHILGPWDKGQGVQGRWKHAAIVMAMALAGGSWLSCRGEYTTGKARIYGLPLPVVGFEQNRLGQWEDYSSPLSIVLAASNVAFWLSLPAPFLILVVRRKSRKGPPR